MTVEFSRGASPVVTDYNLCDRHIRVQSNDDRLRRVLDKDEKSLDCWLDTWEILQVGNID
ncbi:hypothetical protein FRX31_012064 [Thalictrum thalictroides]|uniref:Uncharacterized protein n=1 Tax=Thalictrum thalictroides TaxID=46969 RepID=A0A7J6WLU8_THATH|nr:hypothetical protein FRX31_012064 [Thalictrum thalictroides]